MNNVTIPGNMLFPYDAASTGASVSAVFDYASIQLAAQRINQGILIRLGSLLYSHSALFRHFDLVLCQVSRY